MSATFVLFLTTIALIQSDHRKVEINRIKTYELIYINIDNNIVEFDAFNNHYKIQLQENIRMIPSNVKHTNGIPKHINIEPYYTSLTKSCHYYGKVLSDTTDPLQRVSLSLCNKRGIRGEIRAFNETLIIKPSKYYLDIEYDNNNFHDITDEHLVWKYSDFDHTGIPNFGSINIDYNIPSTTSIQSIANTIQNKNKRRRMAYNNGYNQVELLILSDYAQTKYYRETYGNSWYEQLSSDMADNVNAVSSRYMAVDFERWNIGQVSVHLVEFEVMFEFTGNYAAMNPGCLNYDNCNIGWDHCECTISGTTYLNKLGEYIKNYKDQSTFDNAQLITKYYFENAAGWGWVGVVCKTENSCANMVANYGVTSTVVGMAHEMGHNFGANHDGSGNDCASGLGMMGGAEEGFSRCSMQSFAEYFHKEGGLTCLGTGVRNFKSNYNDGSNGGGTDPGNGNGGNNGGNTGDGSTCIGIRNLQSSYGIDFNGYWESISDGYYSKDGYYLYYYSGYGLWIIASDFDGSLWAYCNQQTIGDCNTNTWHYGDYGIDWTLDSDASIYACDDTGNGNGNGDGNDNACSYYNCIGLWGMSVSWDGNDLNKYYYPNGCRNGVGKYKSTDGAILYKTSSGWSIYNQESDEFAYVYCRTDSGDPIACANKMMYASNNVWSEDNDVYVYDCSSNAFNVEDDCENIGLYNNGLCIRNGLGYNESEWILLGDMCENNMPVYYFEDSANNITYYLHYEEQKKYVNSNETISKWIISMDEISNSEYAYCEQKDLLSCIESEWYSQYDEDSDALGFNNEERMIILNRKCKMDSKEDDGNNGNKSVQIMTIVMLVIGLLVLGAIVGFCIYKTFGKRIRQEKIKSKMEQVADVDEEPEVEVEVNMTQTIN